MASITVDFDALNDAPTKSKRHHVFNSITKLQDFFGVDDIEELKHDVTSPKTRNSATDKLKNIFSCPSPYNNNSRNDEHTKKIQRDTKRINRELNKLRKQKKPKCKLFGKLKDTKSAPLPSINTDSTSNEKILWRPTLQTIFKDELLLNTLIKYMEKSYNSENILFLKAVKELNSNKIIQRIDTKIISIYNLYIELGAEYQINLSYDCYMDIISKRNQFMNYNLTQKRSLFNKCVDEIEILILTSVLSSFYSSSLFQNIARKSKYYKVYLANNHPKSPSYRSSSNSPFSSLSSPPIKLDMSTSTESLFEFDA